MSFLAILQSSWLYTLPKGHMPQFRYCMLFHWLVLQILVQALKGVVIFPQKVLAVSGLFLEANFAFSNLLHPHLGCNK